MKNFLKFGGLLFSAGLTMSLFIRLFGTGAAGIIFSLAALVLFEGGVLAWSKIIDVAEQGQRGLAYAALWFCAIVSVMSSATEIILATSLWQSPIDLNFVTLIIIAAALAVNLLGVLRYEQLDPDKAEQHRELNRLAKESAAQASIEESFTMHAVMQAKSKAKAIAGDIAEHVGESIKASAVKRMTKGAPVMSYAREGAPLPMSTASAGGGDTFSRAEVEQMIAQAIAQARAVEDERKGNARPKA